MRRTWIADLWVIVAFQMVLFFVMFILGWGVAENCAAERVAACEERVNQLSWDAIGLGLLASAGFVVSRKFAFSAPRRVGGLLSSGVLC